ncbi:hypothetical protein [Flavobacterium sp. CAU 1735]|uniref:hypothetical protein n=1 Tax=Flavobacterium sp. CAU 1735 TaxID=3140361 RepID=UPI0032600EBC
MSIPNLFEIIKDATKSVPSVKYAIGVSGIIAVVALVTLFNIDLKIALWGTIILFSLMIMLVVFSKLANAESSEFRHPIRILLWSVAILFISASLLLTTSVFFKFPVDLQYVLVKDNTASVGAEEIIKPDKDFVVSKQAIKVNYMRLFGAIEVPLLLKIMENDADLGRLKGDPSYGPRYNNEGDSIGRYSFYKLKNVGIPISYELANFWKNKWDYKDATVLKTKLWSQYSGNLDNGKKLYWSALAPTIEDVMTYCKHPDIDEYGHYPYDMAEKMGLNVSIEEIDKMKGTESSDIGFLFGIFTNTSNSEIFDVELAFHEYINSFKIESERIEQYRFKTDPYKKALLDAGIEMVNPESHVLKIASLKPNKSVIWLLSLYKKKENGLPLFYLSNVTRPISVTYNLEQQKCKDSIRSPYGEMAARLEVPSGWFGQ